jgi:hypothetical protein
MQNDKADQNPEDASRPDITSLLTDAQRRGAACIRCGLHVDASTAVLLPHRVDDEGVRLFPRRHEKCPAPSGSAFWAHIEGHDDAPPCPDCTSRTDGAVCDEARHLLRAAFAAAGKP